MLRENCDPSADPQRTRSDVEENNQSDDEVGQVPDIVDDDDEDTDSDDEEIEIPPDPEHEECMRVDLTC